MRFVIGIALILSGALHGPPVFGMERIVDPAAEAILDDGLAQAKPFLEAERKRLAAACAKATPDHWPGLTLREGAVVDAALLREIDGFADASPTTGGLGGKLIVVENLDDNASGEPPSPGSLRAAVDKATREAVPAWIVFSPKLGPDATIRLKQHLRLPGNLTIDGSCAEITLEATSGIVLAFLNGVENVVLTRLAFRKTDYETGRLDGPDSRDAVTLFGAISRIALIHNDLSQCGDGCSDTTLKADAVKPAPGFLTMSFNRYFDQDEVMLFGTMTCGVGGSAPCDPGQEVQPVFNLMLRGNLFLRTGQRHPRVFGSVYIHALNNVFAFSQVRSSNGKPGSTYGTLVTNAARAFIDDNWYIALEPPKRNAPPRLVWTTNSAPRLGLTKETEGFIRLRDNGVFRPGLLAENRSDKVAPLLYAKAPDDVALSRLAPRSAVGCVAARAGRFGAPEWKAELCGRPHPWSP